LPKYRPYEVVKKLAKPIDPPAPTAPIAREGSEGVKNRRDMTTLRSALAAMSLQISNDLRSGPGRPQRDFFTLSPPSRADIISSCGCAAGPRLAPFGATNRKTFNFAPDIMIEEAKFNHGCDGDLRSIVLTPVHPLINGSLD
jgi:hypothetical protein